MSERVATESGNADLTWDAANDVLVQRDGKVVLVGVTVNFPRLPPGGEMVAIGSLEQQQAFVNVYGA